MKYNILAEAENQFQMANQILADDYGIAPNEDMEGTMPEDETTETPNPEADNDGILKIRDIALEGLQNHSSDVDGEKYQFYKKIWLMCDKALSEKESIDGGHDE